MAQNETALRAMLNRLQMISLGVGVIGLGACAVGFTMNSTQFFQSYLMGMMLWVQVSVGCMFILMGHHLAGGKWGGAIQRLLESAIMVFPILGLLFIPILLGLPTLYEWARPEVVAVDTVIQHKALYLNVPFFAARAIVFFIFWSVLAYFFNKYSLELDKTGDQEVKNRMKNISGPGLLFFGLSVTFASFDWMMSLEPHWFSSIYGFMFATGASIAAFAFLIIMVNFLLKYEPFASVIEVRQINDYANFLFGAIMTWGYVQLCQGLIIWSGNVAEFTTWYITRISNGWQYIFMFLALFQFFVPFSLLLIWPLKRNIRLVTAVAVLVFIVRVVDLFFLIAPAEVFHHEGLYFHWLDVVACIGVGGIWMAAFSFVLNRKSSFMPLNDKIQLAQEQGHHGAHNRAATHSY